MSNPYEGLRDATFSTSSGKDVKDTSQISGEAKDSLSGKNSTVQFEAPGSGAGKGPWGGLPSGK